MALISLDAVSFRYRRQRVIDALSLDLNEGGAVAVLGPNGSGKTTLLKLMLGILHPDGGRIWLDGREIRRMDSVERARRLAYVPQVHREAFGYRVRDVVLMGRMPHSGFLGRYGARDRQCAATALERLGIDHLAERPYTGISGGERQLALIARALAQEARILILDEPTNGLDYGNQLRLLERLKALAGAGYTIVFSTHHPDHALAVADRVVMMRQGRIIRDGQVCDTLTSGTLQDLYGVDVSLYSVEEGVRVCVPTVRLGCGYREHSGNELDAGNR